MGEIRETLDDEGEPSPDAESLSRITQFVKQSGNDDDDGSESVDDSGLSGLF